MRQRNISTKCPFHSCTRQTRRFNGICVLHKNSRIVRNLNKNNKVDTKNTLYLKKIYEQMQIERTLNQYQKVLSELRYKSEFNEWELLDC